MQSYWGLIKSLQRKNIYHEENISQRTHKNVTFKITHNSKIQKSLYTVCCLNPPLLSNSCGDWIAAMQKLFVVIIIKLDECDDDSFPHIHRSSVGCYPVGGSVD